MSVETEDTPHSVLADRSIRIVDVRDQEERHAGVGYIPGSRSIPESALRADPGLLLASYSAEDRITVVCQSGRRSAGVVMLLRRAGFSRAKNLAGGMLAWRAAGLPTSGVEPPPPDEVPVVSDLGRFPRVLSACFVASTVEHAGDDPTWNGLDPVQLVGSLVAEEAGGDAPTAQALLRVLDRIAEIARQRGFPLDLIRTNVDLMAASLLRAAGR